MRADGRSLWRAVAAVFLAPALLLAGEGAAVGGVPTLVSKGETSDQGERVEEFKGMTSDASDIFFESQGRLTTDDPENYRNLDVFVRHDGRTELVSIAEWEAEAYYAGASADGERAFYQVFDGATAMSLYRWQDGAATRIGPAGGDVFPSRDGSVVYYESFDTIRRWEDGESEVVVGDPEGGAYLQLKAGSADGERAVFESTAQFSPGDDDGYSMDVFVVDDSGISLISGGGSEQTDARFHAASSDARRVIFGTDEELVRQRGDRPSQSDGRDYDLFERLDGQTRMLTPGRPSGVTFAAASDDARRVMLESYNRLKPADRNEEPDLYASDGGVITQLTRGESGRLSGSGYLRMLGSSADGSEILFSTTSRLSTQDRDGGSPDIYCYRDGQARLVSRGGGRVIAHQTAAISADGSTIAYDTPVSVTRADRDGFADVYAQRDGEYELLTSGTDEVGRGTATKAISADGTTVVFQTEDALAPDDQDGNFDIYSVTRSARP